MSDSFSKAETDHNQIIYRFILKSKESGKAEQPNVLAKEIAKWTEGNSWLTQSLCQIILERQDTVVEGQESGYVERIVRSLDKYWENDQDKDYYPHFQSIKAAILKNQQVTTVLLRLHEILLQKEVVATESLEDTILLNSGLVVRQKNQLRIANPIYAAIFNSEWIKQQLNQISHKLIAASEETEEVNRVQRKKIPFKVWSIIALLSFGIAGTILSYIAPWSSFSLSKKCRLVPKDLDLAATVLVACDRIISRQPNNTEALINRGKVSLVLWNASRNQSRIDSAMRDFTQARKLEPNNPQAAFYQSYLQEFQELVINKAPNCSPISDRNYDLLILDWMLPEVSGISLCSQYRQLGKTSPVLILTAKDKIVDKVTGLDAGADDYLVKPIDLVELLARVRALSRRSPLWQGNSLAMGDLQLYLETLSVNYHQQAVQLSMREFQLLEYLLRHPRQVLSRDQIEQALWQWDSIPESNAVTTLVRRLRQRLDQIGAADWLETIYGMGHCLREPKES